MRASVGSLARLQDVLEARVGEAGAADATAMLRAAADAIEGTGSPLALRIVPFVPGRRPEHEAAHPGLGSSEEVAVILPGGQDDPACVLFTLPAAGLAGVSVQSAVAFRGPDGRMEPEPVWDWRDLPV